MLRIPVSKALLLLGSFRRLPALCVRLWGRVDAVRAPVCERRGSFFGNPTLLTTPAVQPYAPHEWCAAKHDVEGELYGRSCSCTHGACGTKSCGGCGKGHQWRCSCLLA